MRLSYLWDILGGIGLLLIVVGLAIWSVPLALVALGGSLLGLGLWGAKKWES